MSKIPAAAVPFLASIIKDREGLELKAYRCPAGVVTIGYGFTGKIPPECADIGTEVKMGMVITKEQAERLLTVSMDIYWQTAIKYSPNLINANPRRQAAVVDFVYNCGGGNYKISSFLLSVNKEDWAAAAVNVKKWNKARVKGVMKVLQGLVIRRQMEADLILHP